MADLGIGLWVRLLTAVNNFDADINNCCLAMLESPDVGDSVFISVLFLLRAHQWVVDDRQHLF
jgi:hypothetical protein